MSILKSFLYVVYTILCFFMILIVLIQKGAEEDLGGAFGGGGSAAESFLGAKGDKTLKKVTVVFAICFFALSIIIGALELNSKDASVTGDSNTKLKGNKKKKSKLPQQFLVPRSTWNSKVSQKQLA